MYRYYDMRSEEIEELRRSLEALAIKVADAESGTRGDVVFTKLALMARMLIEHCGGRCAALDGVDCRDCEEFGEFLEWLEVKAYERDLEERAEKENYYEGEE